MNERIIKLKENYVKDTKQIRHNISKTQKRINTEKEKLAKYQCKFDKAQLEFINDVSMILLDMVSAGKIDVKDLPAIKSYLFDDIDSLDVSSEVFVSSSTKDNKQVNIKSYKNSFFNVVFKKDFGFIMIYCLLLVPKHIYKYLIDVPEVFLE